MDVLKYVAYYDVHILGLVTGKKGRFFQSKLNEFTEKERISTKLVFQIVCLFVCLFIYLFIYFILFFFENTTKFYFQSLSDLETLSKDLRQSFMYPSFPLSDFKRPCLLKSRSGIHLFAAVVAPPARRLCEPKFPFFSSQFFQQNSINNFEL